MTRPRSANGRFLAANSEPAGATTTTTTTTTPSLELYLLRHADAGDSSAWTGADADRPLSKKGRRQAKALAWMLRDLGLRVDAVITSPLLRAVQTAKPVAKATGVEVLADERLGYGFGTPELSALVAQLGPDMQRVVLVGHDPGFTEVASHLLGAHLGMAKGALARIDLPDREVKRGAGDLRWLIPPDAVAR